MAPLPVPETVAGGRFVLGEVLGRGGAATVYLAHDTALDLPRAVKVLRIGHEAIRERFLAEARALARIRHPNVLRVVDYGETGETPWMVMDLARGGTLGSRIDSGPLPVAEVCRVTLETLSGLSAIHDAGYVHRDLKPSNILMGDDDEAWVSDLGVIAGSDTLVTRLWRTSGALGTIGYQSPELRRDAQQVDARTDLYSVGATIWALATATAPIDLSVVDLRPDLLERLPVELAAIAVRATRSNPAERYADCTEMARDVARVHAEMSPTAPSVSVAMAEFERLRRRAGSGVPSGSPSFAVFTPPKPARTSSPAASPRPAPEPGSHTGTGMDRLALLVAAGLLVLLCLLAAALLT